MYRIIFEFIRAGEWKNFYVYFTPLTGNGLIKFVNLYMYNCEIDYGASQGAELERN